MNGDGSVENKRIKEMAIDLFSELPDSLVIHTLSFLNLKEAAATSVLSKRWEFFWTQLPSLQLWDDSGEIDKVRKFVSLVNRALSIRKVNYLDKLDVSFNYRKVFSSDVDAWVQFAVENKVKILNLQLNGNLDDLYTPPQAMYCCPSLTTLSLKGCSIDLKRKIEWQSLTDLHLHLVFVDERLLDEILSSCPLLYSLILEGCSGFNRLEVNSPSVHCLKIVECNREMDAPWLKISAPYLYSLDVSLPEAGRKIQLEDEKISSLVRADIDFQGFPWESSGEDVTYDAEEFLIKVPHVKELYVGLHFVQLISNISVMGFNLPHSAERKILVVTSDIECDTSIYGIIGLIESSPNLETLVIKGSAREGDPAAGLDLKCEELSHLKSISILNFADPYGEPMLTLAEILLKKATGLESMDIVLDAAEDDDFLWISEELQLVPRASINAEIVIKRH